MNIWKKRIYPGIITSVILTVVALWFKAGAIETDITDRTQSIVGDWANVTVDGRDVVIKGVASDSEKLQTALKKLNRVQGIRVLNVDVDAIEDKNSNAQKIADTENAVAKKAAEEAAMQTKAAEAEAVKTANEALNAENEEAKLAAEKAAQEAAEKVKQAEAAELAAKEEAEAKDIAAKEAAAKKAEDEAKALADAKKAEEEAKALAEKAAAEAKALEAAKIAEQNALKAAEVNTDATIDALPTIPQYYIEVKKSQTGLEITGIASNEYIRTQLLDKVKAMNPGIDIDETLIVEDGLENKFQDTVAFGMKQLERLDNGQFTIESDSLSIFGNAKSLDNYEAFYQGLTDSKNADLNIDKVNVKAPKISPYLFAIDYDGDTVHLTGFVPNEKTRNKVKAIMQNTYPGIQTTENLQIASGEPDDFLARVRQAAAKLSLFPKGIATMTDAEVKLEDASGELIKADGGKAKTDVQKTTKAGVSNKPKNEKIGVVKKKPVRKFKLAENQTCQELFDQLLSSKQVLFEPGKAVIASKSLPVLKTLVRIAERCPSALLQISGHTDSDGDDALNQNLSLARAKAVRSYLSKNGISGKRLLAVGYGEKRPIASNDSVEGKQKNRRIEFYVIEQ